MTPSELITRSLDSIRLAYAMQTNAAGHPFAAFAMNTPSGLQFTTTVIAQGTWLNIGVFRVVPGPAHDGDLKLFANVNREWHFGRVFFNTQDNSYQAAIGIDAADGIPSEGVLRAMFDHAGSAAQSLRAYDVPRLAVPAAETTLDDVKNVLRSLGVQFVDDEARGAVGWGMMEPDGARYSIELQLAGGVLAVRGIHHGDRDLVVDRALLEKTQGVNARLAAGTLQLDLETSRLYYELAMPLAWWPFTPGSARRWLDQTRIVMRHVEQTF